LPDGEAITEIFDEIKKQGYGKILAVTISSGLSGTYNVVRLLGEQYEGLETYVLDTKNIGIGAGFLRDPSRRMAGRRHGLGFIEN
jgi:fatty acid-binding protein DegV